MTKLSKKQNDQNQMGLFERVKKFSDIKLRKGAGYLSKKAQRIPERKLARTLISIFLIIILALTYKLFYLFKQRMQIEFPSVRAPVSKPFDPPSVDAIVLRRIRNFHHYLDSVKRSNEPLYDSLMRKRPHLMDSLVTIEKLTNQ